MQSHAAAIPASTPLISPSHKQRYKQHRRGDRAGQYIQVASKTLYVVILKHTTCIIKKFECQCLPYLCPSSVFQRHNIHAVGAIKQTLVDSQNTRQRSSRRLSNSTITSMPFCLLGSYSLLASTVGKPAL